MRFRVSHAGAVAMATLALVLSAASIHAEVLEYSLRAHGGEPVGRWLLERTVATGHREIRFSAEAEFRIILPILYRFSGSARYRSDGTLLYAESYIDTIGFNHYIEVTRSGNGLTVRRRKPGRDWRTLRSDGATVTTLAFFNPESARAIVESADVVEFQGIDLERGSVQSISFTVDRFYSDQWAQPVLRLSGETMEFWFDPDTMDLLYNRVREMGMDVEMVLIR